MNYWIFKTNPAIYDFDKQMQIGEPPIYWRVTRYKKEIKAGDIAFIWRAGPSRGIIAIADVTSDLWHRDYDPNDPVFSGEDKVNIKIVNYFPTIESDFLKTVPGLENLSTFHGYQAIANFRVTQAEGEIIYKLISKE
jgi:predicted RNA-binding protein with PUA-like domain